MTKLEKEDDSNIIKTQTYTKTFQFKLHKYPPAGQAV